MKRKLLIFALILFTTLGLFMIGLTGVEKNTVKAETQTIDTTSEEFKQGFRMVDKRYRSTWTYGSCGISFVGEVKKDIYNQMVTDGYVLKCFVINRGRYFDAIKNFTPDHRTTRNEAYATAKSCLENGKYVEAFEALEAYANNGSVYGHRLKAGKSYTNESVYRFTNGVKGILESNMNHDFFGIYYFEKAGVERVYATANEDDYSRSMSYTTTYVRATQNLTEQENANLDYYINKGVSDALTKAGASVSETIDYTSNLQVEVLDQEYLDTNLRYNVKYGVNDITETFDAFTYWSSNANWITFINETKTINATKVGTEEANKNISVSIGKVTQKPSITVMPYDISKGKVEVVGTLYTNNVKNNLITSLTVNKNLVEDPLYISRINNNNNGYAKITITGSGNLTGSVEIEHEYTFKINYELFGGLLGENPVTEYTVNTPTFNLTNNVTRVGYTLSAWKEDGTALTQITKGSFGDKTLTATYTQTIGAYIQDNGDGTWNSITTTTNANNQGKSVWVLENAETNLGEFSVTITMPKVSDGAPGIAFRITHSGNNYAFEDTGTYYIAATLTPSNGRLQISKVQNGAWSNISTLALASLPSAWQAKYNAANATSYTVTLTVASFSDGFDIYIDGDLAYTYQDTNNILANFTGTGWGVRNTTYSSSVTFSDVRYSEKISLYHSDLITVSDGTYYTGDVKPYLIHQYTDLGTNLIKYSADFTFIKGDTVSGGVGLAFRMSLGNVLSPNYEGLGTSYISAVLCPTNGALQVSRVWGDKGNGEARFQHFTVTTCTGAVYPQNTNEPASLPIDLPTAYRNKYNNAADASKITCNLMIIDYGTYIEVYIDGDLAVTCKDSNISTITGTGLGVRSTTKMVTITNVNYATLPESQVKFISLDTLQGGFNTSDSTYVTNAKNSIAVNTNTPFTSGTISVDITFKGGDSGIVFGYSNSGSATWEGSGISYYFLFLNKNGTIILGKTNNGAWSALTSKQMGANVVNKTYNLKLVLKGNKIIGIFENQVVLTYVDNAFLTGTGFGLRAGTCGVAFSNLTVTDYTGTFTTLQGGFTSNVIDHTSTSEQSIIVDTITQFSKGSISVDVKASNTSDNGIVFGYSNSGAETWEGNGLSYYFLFINKDGRVILGKTDNGVWSTVGESNDVVITDFSITYNLTLIYQEGAMVVYLDDTLLFTCYDSEPLTGTGYGIRAGGSGVEFTGFTITPNYLK